MVIDYKKSFNELVERVNLRLDEIEESEYLMEDDNSDEIQFYNGMRSAYEYVNQLATILKKGKNIFGP